jgi:DNA-binding transcriptional LysR family regulator
LREFEAAPLGLQLVWPSNRQQPRRVKALIDMLVREFSV